ncbi:hypothetical protein [Patulibacter minatonensis]|uniref:hypothetical protein n=1 Tax=Patulibacter minatonensis TaxID=298163 RepID=UPI00047E95F2|nr:hypothetical protein [Patulibacter minatonensis]
MSVVFFVIAATLSRPQGCFPPGVPAAQSMLRSASSETARAAIDPTESSRSALESPTASFETTDSEPTVFGFSSTSV